MGSVREAGWPRACAARGQQDCLVSGADALLPTRRAHPPQWEGGSGSHGMTRTIRICTRRKLSHHFSYVINSSYQTGHMIPFFNFLNLRENT